MWWETVAGTLLTGIAIDLVAVRYRRRKARIHHATHETGAAITFHCALRQPDSSRPRWRFGNLTLTSNHATWSSRLRTSPPILINPTTTHILTLRRVAGRESLRIDPNVAIIVLLITGSRLELGVYPQYLDILGRVFDIPDRPAIRS